MYFQEFSNYNSLLRLEDNFLCLVTLVLVRLCSLNLQCNIRLVLPLLLPAEVGL